MIKFIHDKRAGGGALAFLVIAMLLIYMFVSFVEPIQIAFTELMLTFAYKKGLDKMQQSGGLTAEIENQIKDYLTRYGFNRNEITVSGTIATVEWGDEIGLTIVYNAEYKVYTITNLITVSSETKTAQLVLEGSTTSYYFATN